ncbi:hypothetical protein [Xanthobacter sp. KR7-225]|uniref:hypothetical protein n=1 Tax=Xanthobacter sp. KR7-225 TaxID=3156613 RepID=UPI0032B61871
MTHHMNDLLRQQDTEVLARDGDPAIYRRLCGDFLSAYDLMRSEGATASPAKMTAMLDRFTLTRRAQLLPPAPFCQLAWAAFRKDLTPEALTLLARHVRADMERLYRDEERTVENLRDLVTRSILLMAHIRAEKGFLGFRFDTDWRLARRRRAFASARIEAIWEAEHPTPQVVREAHTPIVHQHVHVAPTPSGRF